MDFTNKDSDMFCCFSIFISQRKYSRRFSPGKALPTATDMRARGHGGSHAGAMPARRPTGRFDRPGRADRQGPAVTTGADAHAGDERARAGANGGALLTLLVMANLKGGAVDHLVAGASPGEQPRRRCDTATVTATF